LIEKKQVKKCVFAGLFSDKKDMESLFCCNFVRDSAIIYGQVLIFKLFAESFAAQMSQQAHAFYWCSVPLC